METLLIIYPNLDTLHKLLENVINHILIIIYNIWKHY